MKKLLLFIALAEISIVSYSQTPTWTPGTGFLYSNPSTTKIGIGVSDPHSMLDVNGNIQIRTASIPMGLLTENGGTYQPIFNMCINFRDPDKNTTYQGASFRIDTRGGTNPIFSWLYRPPLGTTDTYLMNVSSSGNVGIGGTPGTNDKLFVSGIIRATSFIGDGSQLTGIASQCGGQCTTGDYIIKGKTNGGNPAIITAGQGSIADGPLGGAVTLSGGVDALGQDGTPAVIKVEGVTNQLYPLGGSITLTAGTGYVNGNINLNTSAGGKIMIHGNTTIVGGLSASTISSITYDDLLLQSSYHTRMTIKYSTGNIGIGTSNPLNKLDIAGGMVIGSTYSGTNIAPTNGLLVEGNIVIGKTIPQLNSSYKLEVEGKIRSTEIVVNSTGADFVFEKNYTPLSLFELERFITSFKHLPEIPSASEMQTNGVSISEMQTKLLQKVEELTLYMIELKKENDQLKKEIEIIKTR